MALGIGVLLVVPPWQGFWIPAKIALIAYGVFIVVSLVLQARTWVAIVGETLHVQGRLVRTAVDLRNVRRFVAEDVAPSDLWSWFTLPFAGAAPPITGVRMELRDGSFEVLGPVLGSIGACTSLAVELNRRLRETRSTEEV